MIVFDVAPYWREAWAFEARQRLWAQFAPDVDYQPVALVGDRTHRGEPKPSNLPPPPAGVAVVPVTLDAGTDWGREEQQRDAVHSALAAHSDDLVLLGDADEIVDPRRLDAILAATEQGPVKLAMALYFYGSRWRYPRPWTHAGACRARDLPQSVSRSIRLAAHPVVPDAGWHLSYVGDWDAKLKAFAHSEVDTPEFRATLQRGAELGTSPGGGEALIDDPLPADIVSLLGVAA